MHRGHRSTLAPRIVGGKDVMAAPLSVVSENGARPAAPAPEVLSERIKRLQAEAKGLAAEQVQALQDALAELERMAADIAGGGDAYAVGVREIARKLAVDCRSANQTIGAIVSRR
jgi:hypothetical protein